ncbi:MAG: NAD(+)/NADH kinase [Deltaproteobacteria bacterium]|nr:NAD(+)/NADH kinase [Deltaproteobacteria bacterium]
MQVLLVHKNPRPEATEIHDESLRLVENALTQRQIAYEICERECLTSDKAKEHLVVTVGGDGTFLDAAHYLHSKGHSVLFGVNSNQENSVGSLCAADSSNFEAVLDGYTSGKLKPIRVMRLQIALNGKKLETSAFNDILIVHENPASMTRYWIEFGGEKVFHKNSGLWVCTPMGSTGAVCSTGGVAQPMDDGRLQWIVREPYFASEPRPKLLSGFVGEQDVLCIKSSTKGGRIYIDGPHVSEDFEEGSELKLSIVHDDLQMLFSQKMEQRRQQIGLLREKYARRYAESGTRTRTGVPG